MNGTNGTNGTNGAPGANGVDGASVTITTLTLGDQNCPFGGTRFNVGTSTGYACHGGPQPLATGWTIELLVGTTSYGTFAAGSFGMDVAIIETTVIGPGGNQIILPLPGQLTYRPIVLEGLVTANREAWLWREAALSAASGFRRNAVLRLANGTTTIATYNLTNAWPSRLELASGDGLLGRPPRFRLTLVTDATVRASVPGGGTATPLPTGVTAWDLAPLGSTFSGIEGVQSGNAVVSPAPFSPGRLELPRLTLTRPLDRHEIAWVWFNQVRQGNTSAARTTVTISAPTVVSVSVTNALPFSYGISLGSDGQPMESIFISGEGASRLP
jgi:hypothetical protein